MVFAEIRHDDRTALVRVNGALSAKVYRDEILQHHVVPLIINVTGGICQHANARLHTARVCRDFLQQNKTHVLPWPSKISSFLPNRTLL